MIPGAESKLALFTPDGHKDRIGTFQSLTFWCDDVTATAKTLASKGVEITQEPTAADWGTFALFKDADGNQFVMSSR
jgi:predicted enzyme related to lactoylglutathione lyase